MSENAALAAVLSLGVTSYMMIDYTDIGCYSTVPTEDHVLVPETLLKKRKSQEKAREARSEELAKKKEVSYNFLFYICSVGGLVMIPTIPATRLSGQCCRFN